MIDLHIHSSFSPDSQLSLSKIIELTKDFIVVAITDHYDLEHNGKEFKVKNLENYIDTVSNLKNNVSQKLLVGIEIGMVPNIFPKEIPFEKIDYVIGSIHSVPGLLDVVNEDPDYVIKNFMDTTYRVVEQNDYFHSLGHLDYILRYITPKTLAPYKSEVYDILNILVRKDKLLEVNTSGYFHALGRQHPEKWILEAFLEMGGRISIGSDAHIPEMIGYKIADAIRFVKDIGYDEICYAEGGGIRCIPI